MAFTGWARARLIRICGWLIDAVTSWNVIDEKRKLLNDKLQELHDRTETMTNDEREELLREIGEIAFSIDCELVDHPDAAVIAEETDQRVDEVELLVDAAGLRSRLADALPRKVREEAHRKRM